MKKIIYKTKNNGVAILHHPLEWNGNLQELALKNVPHNTPWKIVDETEIPTDRTFRDAWEWED